MEYLPEQVLQYGEEGYLLWSVLDPVVHRVEHVQVAGQVHILRTYTKNVSSCLTYQTCPDRSGVSRWVSGVSRQVIDVSRQVSGVSRQVSGVARQVSCLLDVSCFARQVSCFLDGSVLFLDTVGQLCPDRLAVCQIVLLFCQTGQLIPVRSAVCKTGNMFCKIDQLFARWVSCF